MAGRKAVDWTTRVILVVGAARGLACIHAEHATTKIPHGNIKSSNILLDRRGSACVSDFGLALLLSPALATARLGGYRAPEQAQYGSCSSAAGNNISHKSDVYAFGVLLLEVLTGREVGNRSAGAEEGDQEVDLVRWVKGRLSGELMMLFDPELERYVKRPMEGREMGAMLRVGLACVADDSEARPPMGEVLRMLQEIRVEEAPLGDHEDEDEDDLDEIATVTTTTTATDVAF